MEGGSTLFFDVTQIASTRSAIIAAELIQARYRETIHVLNEIDELLPTLTKEWVNVSRLWRTGNGYRMLRARELAVLIHVKEYNEIRNHLVKELNVPPDKVAEESNRLTEEGKSDYLQISITLDEFLTGLIASRGIRGEFEPHYKTWIDHEGLDEF
jgi:transcription initiation factor TFIIIB Brf1 subunit/transcription initiation factor TFIIB